MKSKYSLAVVLIAGCFLMLPAGGQVPATRSGFVITADGARIHYLEARPNPAAANGPAMLFVPGWTMPAWIWEKQTAYFSKTHRVVAMDPRAQGESTKAPEGLYPAVRARDIKAVVDQLKLEPVVLVGWSMGVPELCAFVDQFGTDSVAGLVFVDGIPALDLGPEQTKSFLNFFAGFQKDRRKATEAFVRSMYKQPQSEEYLERVTAAALQTPTNAAMALGLGALASDYRPALAKINRPTLIVAANSPFASAYEDTQKRIGGSRLVTVENAGHALFVDQSERFNFLLEDFLRHLK